MVGAQRITAATVSQRRTWSRSTRQQQHRSDASGSTVTPCLQERGTRGRYIAATTRAPRSPRSPHFCKRVGPADAASQPRLERSALQPRLYRSDARGAAARGSSNIAATPLAARSPLVFKRGGHVAATLQRQLERHGRHGRHTSVREWDPLPQHHSRDWSAAHYNRDWNAAMLVEPQHEAATTSQRRHWQHGHHSSSKRVGHAAATSQQRLGHHGHHGRHSYAWDMSGTRRNGITAATGAQRIATATGA
jgi:hypothetical protein